MLEFLTFKKVKKHRDEEAAKQKTEQGKENKAGTSTVDDQTTQKPEAKPDNNAASPSFSPKIISKPPDDDEVSIEGTPILDREDEKFLERLTSPDASIGDEDESEAPPPLPPRVKTPVIEIESDTSSLSIKEAGKGAESEVQEKGKGKGKEEEKKQQSGDKPKRFSFVTNISRNITLRRKHAAASPSTSQTGLQPDHLAVPSSSEAAQEESDMARVLDDLDLSAKNNRVFSLSSESAEMVRKFTQVLKDLVNGVPTAYGDLVSLLDDRDGILARNFEKLPSSLKKLVAQLPEKLTSSLAPEILAAAAEAQGLSAVEEGASAGLKDAAKKFMTPGNLRDLVTKPGALVGLLKGIVNALKTRFPAFIGTNVLWSLAVFLLLSMLWYCHKRGREVRLEREASETQEAAAEGEGKTDDAIDGKPRVEELPDDPMLPGAAAPEASAAHDGANTRS